MAYTLRQATRADVAAMHAVRMSVRENRLTRSVISERDYIEHLERIGRGWVLEIADRIVALVIVNARDGNIWGLFVHPDFERRGLGRRLLDAAVEWLWSEGLSRLWLATAPATRAQKFYESAGWTNVATTEHGEIRFELRRPNDVATRPQRRVSRSGSSVSTIPDDLFGRSPAWPSGLTYLPQFLPVADERRLLTLLAGLPMHEAQYYQYTAKRRIASFGFSYDFASKKLGAAPPLPDFLIELRQRVADQLSFPAGQFEQALINEYRPGTPLGWHRDTPEFESVAGVSLGGPCRMRFRPYPPKPGRDPRTVTLNVAPRSLYLMHNEVRWKWQHSVSPTREQRWSITFRTMRAQSVE